MMRKRFAAMVLLLSCLLLAACGSAATPVKNVKPEIWAAVQPKVAQNLKFPDSAQFGSYEDAIIEEADGKYYVLGEVTASNALGISVKNGFEVYVTPADGGYSVSSVDMMYDEDYRLKVNLHKQKKQREESGEPLLTPMELEEAVKTQELYISDTSIHRASSMTFSSGDMLTAVITNNSDKNIQSAMVAFACWDAHGLPLKILKPYFTTGGSFIQLVNYENINLLPGKTYGKDRGFEISSDMNTASFRAIVVSYEATDGTTWENPHYLDFVEAYEGKELK